MGFNDTWENATAKGGGDNQPPEPGLYEAALTDTDAFVSKAGDEWVKLTLRRVTDNHEWDVMLGFKSQKQANVTKGTLARIGVAVDEVASFDDFKSALKAVEGRYYEVEVKQNGDFVNTYINEQVDGEPEVPADTADMQPAAAGGSDEDIPF
jgi:hypothetical protein